MCFFCYTSGGRSISKQEAAIAQCSFLIERKAEERRRESKPQESLGWLRRKRVGIPFLDVMKESIECYALISKPTSRADRWDAAALRDRGGVSTTTQLLYH